MFINENDRIEADLVERVQKSEQVKFWTAWSVSNKVAR